MRTCLWLRLSGRWHLARTRRTETRKYIKKTKQQLSKSLFTAVWATGTENKHQTQKTLLWIQYWEEWVSWLTGIKGTLSVLRQRVEPTWRCHGNRIPVMTGGQPGESTSRGQKSQHTVAPPPSASPSTSYTEKKNHHHGWTAPILMSSISKLAITLAVRMTIQQSAHCSFFTIQLSVVCACVNHTYVLL